MLWHNGQSYNGRNILNMQGVKLETDQEANPEACSTKLLR
jgi:hypothetical protein